MKLWCKKIKLPVDSTVSNPWLTLQLLGSEPLARLALEDEKACNKHQPSYCVCTRRYPSLYLDSVCGAHLWDTSPCPWPGGGRRSGR